MKETKKIKEKQDCDWIDLISDKVEQYYHGRQVVLWGKYSVSDEIKDRLKEKHGIDVRFYVDGDSSKIDNKIVFSPDCLAGKASNYYVVIPLAYYPSIKEKMSGEGYRDEVDYFYFCDCVIKQEEDYFEDAHGNKIIGNYQGLKFAFSGFNSVIEIGENVSFRNTCIYVHNKCKVIIGNNVCFCESMLFVSNFSKVLIDNDVSLTESSVEVDNCSNLRIEQKCSISFWQMSLGAYASCQLGEKIWIRGRNKFNKGKWLMEQNSELKIEGFGHFEDDGRIYLGENATFKIGMKFSIQRRYDIVVNKFTNMAIGNDCMFSYEIIMRSNDGHTIFDIDTGKNINSTKSISGKRKVVIGNHVWIGARALILYGARICDGSIIGANSLVKRVIPNNCIAAGIPARVIRKNIAWSKEEGTENIVDCGLKYIHHTK